MKTRILSMLSAMALTSGFAQAQSLDTDAALDLARQFFASHSSGASHRAPAQVSPVLSYTATTEGTPDFYVFNRGEEVPGFVIVSADLEADTPILGYAEASSFDYDKIPDSMRWWLQQYQANGVAKVADRVGSTRHSINPIVKTKWNQGAPFNLLIPHEPYADGFVTGCTATAMAQIMKHHRYPEQGNGSKSYTVTYDELYDITYSADFSSTTYDWDNMLDDYSKGYTPTQANAVATLAYHAGVAERTVFNGEYSSADDRHSAMALIEHFDYDKSMLRAERNFLNDAEWENIIYDELAEGRPIMYSGQSGADSEKSVGHTFICDGYDATNQTFHINWGWSGNYDGYFRLTGSGALRPNGTGIGGAAAGSSYSYHQAINYNIRPNVGGAPKVQIGIIAGGELSVSSSGPALQSYTLDRTQSEETFLHYSLSPYNYGVNTVAFEYGVMFRNTDNGKCYISKAGDTNNLKTKEVTPGGYYVDQDNNVFVFDHTFPTSLLVESGRYEVLPAFRPMGQRDWEVAAYDCSLTIPVITVIGDYVAPEEPLVPDLTDGICFYDYPTMGNKNLADASHLVLTMPVVNNSAADKAISFYGVAHLNVPVNIPVNGEVYSAGTRVNYTSDFSSLKSYMTPGETYIINFYTDSSRSTTMNVPSITFYYDGNSVITVSDVTAIIKKAQEGNAPLKLIKAAVEKTLGK